MAGITEPRRWSLPSELTDDDRVAARRIGGALKVERAEYTRWRERTLAGDRDDLELRARLLREESDERQRRAASAKSAALESLSVEDWLARAAARRDGAVAELHDGDAAALDAEAEELDREALEIDTFLRETA